MALEASRVERRRRVWRVRRRRKEEVCAVLVRSFVVGVAVVSSGTVGRVNFVEKVRAKRLALSVASCVHVPLVFLRGGTFSRGGLLLRS